MTEVCYLIDYPEFYNKFIIAYAPTLDSLTKTHLGEVKATCRFYYNVGLMSLSLLEVIGLSGLLWWLR